MSREQNESEFEQGKPRITELRGRQVIYGLVGAILYAFLYWLTSRFPIPAVGEVIFRPAVVIPVFFGLAYGPWAGFFAGFLGNTLGDALSSGGFYWNWSLGNGLVGMISGFANFRSKDFVTGPGILRAIGWSALSIAVGMMFASLMEIFVSGIDLRTALVDYFPLAFLGNFASALLLLPIMMILFGTTLSRRDR